MSVQFNDLGKINVIFIYLFNTGKFWIKIEMWSDIFVPIVVII